MTVEQPVVHGEFELLDALVQPEITVDEYLHLPAIEMFTTLLDLLQLIIETTNATVKILIKIFIEWLKF